MNRPTSSSVKWLKVSPPEKECHVNSYNILSQSALEEPGGERGPSPGHVCPALDRGDYLVPSPFSPPFGSMSEPCLSPRLPGSPASHFWNRAQRSPTSSH